MPKTKRITVRLDAELKEAAEAVFSELGLSASRAVRMFYQQVRRCNGLPFDVRVPNQVTRRALGDAVARRNLIRYGSTRELFADLGI